MQAGDIPVFLLIDQDQILLSQEINYNGRTLPLIGTEVSYMIGANRTRYFIAAIHQENGIQKP